MTNNNLHAHARRNFENIAEMLALHLDEEMTYPQDATLEERLEVTRLTELMLVQMLLNDFLPPALALTDPGPTEDDDEN